jgi:hypothetical protein
VVGLREQGACRWPAGSSTTAARQSGMEQGGAEQGGREAPPHRAGRVEARLTEGRVAGTTAREADWRSGGTVGAGRTSAVGRWQHCSSPAGRHGAGKASSH